MPLWDVTFDTHLNVSLPDIVTAVARAEAMASVIRGLPLSPAVQQKIDALNIMRAVRGTTGIEGTEISEEEVAEIIASPETSRVLPDSRAREEKEARNAAAVTSFVVEVVRRSPTPPLTEGLICQMHEMITQGIDYKNNVPGRYRNHAVTAGTYTPPRTGEEVTDLMGRFVHWFNEGPPRYWPAAIRAVVAHFYVVSIHPFGDGNGRTARAVESFLLYQGGINARGFYSLSNFYYRMRPEYVGMLDSVRFKTAGDLTPFVTFALEGLVAELSAVHEEVLQEMTVIAFRDFAREELARTRRLEAKRRDRMYDFLLDLVEREAVSLRSVGRGQDALSRFYAGTSSKTLNRDLTFLRNHQLVAIKGDILRANLEVMREFMA